MKCHATGRVTLRNRRFIKPLAVPPKLTTPHPVISPEILNKQTHENQSTSHHDPIPVQPDQPIPTIQPVPNIENPASTTTYPTTIQPESTTDTPNPISSRIPLALKRLRNFNKPGAKE